MTACVVRGARASTTWVSRYGSAAREGSLHFGKHHTSVESSGLAQVRASRAHRGAARGHGGRVRLHRIAEAGARATARGARHAPLLPGLQVQYEQGAHRVRRPQGRRGLGLDRGRGRQRVCAAGAAARALGAGRVPLERPTARAPSCATGCTTRVSGWSCSRRRSSSRTRSASTRRRPESRLRRRRRGSSHRTGMGARSEWPSSTSRTSPLRPSSESAGSAACWGRASPTRPAGMVRSRRRAAGACWDVLARRRRHRPGRQPVSPRERWRGPRPLRLSSCRTPTACARTPSCGWASSRTLAASPGASPAAPGRGGRLLRLRAPAEPGQYRLFVTANGHGAAARVVVESG